MTIFFDRPIGASADVKELEYISALHQTGADGIREDGSIKGEFCLVRFVLNDESMSVKRYASEFL